MFKFFNANFPFKTFKANFLGPKVVKGSEAVQVPLNLKRLTLINISFFPTYLTSHALVTRYLNKMKKVITSFQPKRFSDFVAERITH